MAGLAADAAGAAGVATARADYTDEVSVTLVLEIQAGCLFFQVFIRHPRMLYTAVILFSWIWDFLVNSIIGDVNCADVTQPPPGKSAPPRVRLA